MSCGLNHHRLIQRNRRDTPCCLIHFVAAVATCLLAVVPCPVALPMAAAWIAALVGLHDFGKASPGFQIKLGRSHIGGYRLEKDQPDRHDISTAGLLCDLLTANNVPQRQAAWLMSAV